MTTAKFPFDPNAKRDFRIGSALIPKPQRMSREGEALQAALLAERYRPMDRSDKIVMLGALIAAVAAAVIIVFIGPAV
jgi:hypothetical protein